MTESDIQDVNRMRSMEQDVPEHTLDFHRMWKNTAQIKLNQITYKKITGSDLAPEVRTPNLFFIHSISFSIFRKTPHMNLGLHVTKKGALSAVSPVNLPDSMQKEPPP
jgi:hypothetical protein